MLLQTASVFIYLVVSAIYILNLWKASERLREASRYLVYLGALFHLISSLLIVKNESLFESNFDNLLYVFAFFVVFVFLIYQLKFNTYVLGALLFPLVFLITLPSVVLQDTLAGAVTPISSPLLLVHISITFFSQAIFTLAFFAGLLYLFEQNKIKNKQISGLLKKFPSLSTLDTINHYCLLIGFPVLTIGLALGFVISKTTLGVFLRWHQKEIWAIITWFLYALLIYGRLHLGWKGRRAAVGAIAGFIVIVITFVALGYIVAS